MEWSIGLSLLREFEPSLLLPGSCEDCDFFTSLAQHIGDETATHSNFQDDMELSNPAFPLSDESKAPKGKDVNYESYSGLTAESETSSRCSERFTQYCRPYTPTLTRAEMKPGDNRHGHEVRTCGAAEKKPRTGGTVPGTRRKASHYARTILMDWIYAHRGR